MEIVYLHPNELIPYENNAKVHTPEQVKRIANSIKAFGFQQPIVVDKDNTVIIGHGRLFAAKELMLDTVPVVRAEDLTDDQVKALRLADNKLNESPYDFSKLEAELAELSIDGFDMEQFGFEEPDLGVSEAKELPLNEKYQLIIDCESEEDMQSKYDQLHRAGFLILTHQDDLDAS